MSLKHDITHAALSGVTDRDTICSYKHSVTRFCDWAKAEYDAKNIKSLKGSALRIDVINAYSEYLQARGYSSSTVHTYFSPVCKGLGIQMQLIEKPKRRAADITKRRMDTANLRGRREAQLDRYARSVALSEATGARSAELAKMTYSDLLRTDESGYRCAIVRRGKHGKTTLQRLSPQQTAVCDDLIARATASGIPLTARVLTAHEISDHIDYHTIRAMRAASAYRPLVDRIAAEGKTALTRELVARWNALNPAKDQIYFKPDGGLTTGKKSRAKKYISELRKAEADSLYCLRGDNRLRALQEGRPVVYNRLALLAVGVFHLAHWRCDVTVTNYML